MEHKINSWLARANYRQDDRLLDAAVWIGPLFPSDGAGIHVSAVYDDVIGQVKQLGLNALDQRIEITAG